MSQQNELTHIDTVFDEIKNASIKRTSDVKIHKLQMIEPSIPSTHTQSTQFFWMNSSVSEACTLLEYLSMAVQDKKKKKA